MPQDYTHGKIQDHNTLLLCVDGGCQPKNPGGIATYGWVIYGTAQEILAEDCAVAKNGGPLATNNYAEYCALGFSLKWLREQNWKGILSVQADSKLLICQVTREWKCNAKHLDALRQRIWEHLAFMDLKTVHEVPESEVPTVHFNWVPREMNAYADELSNRAYKAFLHSKESKKV